MNAAWQPDKKQERNFKWNQHFVNPYKVRNTTLCDIRQILELKAIFLIKKCLK